MGVGEVGMNSTECSAHRDQVEWLEPGKACLLSLLAAVDVMVILGNCLVIAAVYMSSKLRSVTNLFIVSLAVADLMVGLAVLPFSAVWEVFEVSSQILELLLFISTFFHCRVFIPMKKKKV
ncbi:hypothetical protein GE061_015123 [Apolygus lucorum]|uniref:G-protein coupled receptors family 1 profile domain-containing protein n=1 Tax=Apolygus lucorum TaxID=248454 RepID=A0A8S9XMX2_APOLU|nr:hypothetical protein GE061_015123 [Apolygus lucorum]